MPSYDYVCPQCGEISADIRGINDPEPEIKCSKCQTIMKRTFTRCSINITYNGA